MASPTSTLRISRRALLQACGGTQGRSSYGHKGHFEFIIKWVNTGLLNN